MGFTWVVSLGHTVDNLSLLAIFIIIKKVYNANISSVVFSLKTKHMEVPDLGHR